MYATQKQILTIEAGISVYRTRQLATNKYLFVAIGRFALQKLMKFESNCQALYAGAVAGCPMMIAGAVAIGYCSYWRCDSMHLNLQLPVLRLFVS